MGCTVIEMATGKPPWSEFTNNVTVMFHIASAKGPPSIPDHLSPEANDFLRMCFNRNPKERPNATRLLKHPFVLQAGARGPAHDPRPTEQHLKLEQRLCWFDKPLVEHRLLDSPQTGVGAGCSLRGGVNANCDPCREVEHDREAAARRESNWPAAASEDDGQNSVSSDFNPMVEPTVSVQHLGNGFLDSTRDPQDSSDVLIRGLPNSDCNWGQSEESRQGKPHPQPHDPARFMNVVREKAIEDTLRLSLPFTQLSSASGGGSPASASGRGVGPKGPREHASPQEKEQQWEMELQQELEAQRNEHRKARRESGTPRREVSVPKRAQ